MLRTGDPDGSTSGLKRLLPHVGCRPQTREALLGEKPEIPVAIAQSRPNIALGKTIGTRVMRDAIQHRIDLIHSSRGPGVNASVVVFSQTPHLVARKPARVVITADRNPFRVGIVDSTQAGLSASHP